LGIDFLCGLDASDGRVDLCSPDKLPQRGLNSKRDLTLTLVAELRQETRREMTALHELAALFPMSASAAFQQLDAVASKTTIASAPLPAPQRL
jgi:hypothetical protein